jgi:hypothetical protein
VYVVAR